ncbi:MAG: ComF family protein [Candidatus Sulfotelmatobacter sp.]
MGITEAVFSSSGDRIRAIQVEAATAGHSIAVKPLHTWAGRVSIRLAASVFTVLFPSDCRLCGLPLVNISRLPVCPECLSAMRPAAGTLCSLCGERLVSIYAASSSDGEVKCGLCRRIEPPFMRAVAYGGFEGGLRELIHLLKYSGVRPAANVLGRMLAEAIAELKPSFSPSSVIVIPVPLYRGKLRQREFNHAELIARAATKIVGRSGRLQMGPDLLERKRETSSQAGLTSHQRRENVRGAFGVMRPELVKDREILIVDDVYTTGATVSECARVLRRAGATKVWVATVARTMKIVQQQIKIELPGQPPMEVSGEEFPLTIAAAGGSGD